MNERVSFDLSGKRALITGGRGGIGMAIARAMRDFGANVIITGERSGAETIEGFPFRQLDLRDGEAIAALARTVDHLDILVNCAAALVREGKEYEPAVFDDIIDINLNGTFRVCDAFHSHLRASKGCIINIVSMRAFIGSPLGPAYGASKAGMRQLTRTLAIQWGTEGIRVNAIAPGWIRTNMNITVQQDEEAAREIAETAALKRWGEPQEIAGAAVFLASPAASFVTGSCVVADGGFMA